MSKTIKKLLIISLLLPLFAQANSSDTPDRIHDRWHYTYQTSTPESKWVCIKRIDMVEQENIRFTGNCILKFSNGKSDKYIMRGNAFRETQQDGWKYYSDYEFINITSGEEFNCDDIIYRDSQEFSSSGALCYSRDGDFPRHLPNADITLKR